MRSMLLLSLTFLIGGVFFISVLNVGTQMSQTATINNMDYAAQTNLETIVKVLKNDLRKAGYEVDPDEKNEIIDDFDHNSITFNTDIDTFLNSQTMGTIELRQSGNELVRNVKYSDGTIASDESVELNGLDTLHITYFDANGDTIFPGGSPDNIRSFQVKVISTLPYSYSYQSLLGVAGNEKVYKPRAYWKSEIHPKNLGR